MTAEPRYSPSAPQQNVSLDALEMTTYHPVSRIPAVEKQPFLTPDARKNIQVVFEDNDDGPVDALWPVVAGSPPIRQADLSDACLGTVILPLAGSSRPFWDSHWHDRDCKTKFICWTLYCAVSTATFV